MSEKIKDENMVDLIRAICILQFIVVLIAVNFIPNLNKKLIIMLSAAVGVLVSGAATRKYMSNRVSQSIEPLGEEFYKTGKINPDPEQKDQ